MKTFIDLTHNIAHALPVYPGDEETKLYQVKNIKEHEFNNHRLEVSMHAGTHIDGPMHLKPSKKFISQISLDTFIGNGCLLDVRGKQIIKPKEEYEERIKENSIVLLFTGWDRRFGTSEYFSHSPVVSLEFAHFLVKKNIKMLGIDTASPDKYPFEVHKLLFSNNILIIENLTNLDKLLEADNFEVIALPLKIMADSSIARVIARTCSGGCHGFTL